jgi:hypothetical protein
MLESAPMAFSGHEIQESAIALWIPPPVGQVNAEGKYESVETMHALWIPPPVGQVNAEGKYESLHCSPPPVGQVNAEPRQLVPGRPTATPMPSTSSVKGDAWDATDINSVTDVVFKRTYERIHRHAIEMKPHPKRARSISGIITGSLGGSDDDHESHNLSLDWLRYETMVNGDHTSLNVMGQECAVDVQHMSLDSKYREEHNNPTVYHRSVNVISPACTHVVPTYGYSCE